MRRRKTTVEQEKAPTKFVETTIMAIELVEEDIDTIKLRFSFANKAKFTKQFQKYDWNYRNYWKQKKPGDDIRLIIRASKIQDIS